MSSEYSWPAEQMASESGSGINEPPEQHYLQVLGLFHDDDIVWIGRDVYDTGSPSHQWRFRRVREWLCETTWPGAFICPSTFKCNTFSRSDINVSMAKFLVVESDKLN